MIFFFALGLLTSRCFGGDRGGAGDRRGSGGVGVDFRTEYAVQQILSQIDPPTKPRPDNDSNQFMKAVLAVEAGTNSYV